MGYALALGLELEVLRDRGARPVLDVADRGQVFGSPDELRHVLQRLRGGVDPGLDRLAAPESGPGKVGGREPGSPPVGPRVFVSYSHDSEPHRARVLELAQMLRAKGIDAWIDRFVPSPPEGWLLWMQREIERADFVLVLCTPDYRRRFEGEEDRTGIGRGVTWEGAHIRRALYDAQGRNTKFLAVLFADGDPGDVPSLLREFTYRHPDEFEGLLRYLTDQPEVVPARLGPLPELPPVSAGAGAVPAAARQPVELESMILELERTRAAGGDVASIAERIRVKKASLRQSPTLQAGDVLGDDRFVLEAILGAGGFAQVWRAWDRRREQFVALKILHGQYLSDATRVRRFLAGARKQSRLSHPHVVQVLEPELKDESGWLFFAMELVEGTDLRSAVLADAIGRDQVLEVLRGLASALDQAWERFGIVHRDVKPANVLLDRDGTARLSDFDLVLAPESSQGTLLGQGMGTYDFAAPEVLRGEGNATHVSDVYSLAMTALWALSGGQCLRGSSEESWAAAGLSAGECDAIRRSLAEDPADRHPTSGAFVEEIEAEEPPGAETSGSIRSRWMSRRSVLLGGITVVAAGGALAAYRVLGAESHDPPREGSMRLAPRGEYQLVRIPGGKVLMGSSEAEQERWAAGDEFSRGLFAHENPRHEVELEEFFLGMHPVTNEEYARYLEANPGTTEPEYWGDRKYNQSKQPVVGVSWEEAQAYCEWAGLVLPTEAQWEYACRAGRTTAFWSGGQEEDLAQVGWYVGNSEGRLHPVGKKPANSFGLHDVHGNVWEWCRDWFESYSKDPVGGPEGERRLRGSGDRVARGGSFSLDAGLARSALRNFAHPSGRNINLGFRAARTPRAPFCTEPGSFHHSWRDACAPEQEW